MNTRQWLLTTFSNHRRWLFSLPVVWILGMLLGIAVASNCNTYVVVNVAVMLRPNLCLLFLLNASPVAVLITLFAVRRYGLICVVLFFHGLLRGFCEMCTVLVFGSSSWLVRCLLLFSSSFVSVLMWWLVFSFVNRKRCHVEFICYSALFICCVTIFDYFVISPFLIGIF